MKQQSKPGFFKRIFNTKAAIASGIVLSLSIILLTANYVFLTIVNNQDTKHIAHISELRLLAEKINKNVSETVSGKIESFVELKKNRDDFEQRLNLLKNGDENSNLNVAPMQLDETLIKVQNNWNLVKDSIDIILERKDIMASLRTISDQITATIPVLQSESEEIVDLLLEQGFPADQIVIAQRQSLILERILSAVNGMLVSSGNAMPVADIFGRDANLLGRVLRAFQEGSSTIGITKVTNPQILEHLAEMETGFLELSEGVDGIFEVSAELFQIREAASSIFALENEHVQSIIKLDNEMEQVANSRTINTILGYILIGIVLITVSIIGFSNAAKSKRNSDIAAAENKLNQAAILRLLDEISALSEGDLTVHATVTEDFTGAIADSINFSITQLRDIVSNVTTTAISLSEAAKNTRDNAVNLAEASNHQALEINAASTSIINMANSIDQVSANAAQSARVAERSVTIANKGSEVVRNTIEGMENIREQIQDTSKRIKRLGESSQEIGDIVGLINDIADQTNILALNAAIQASMAGEAGRGFAVVADEVQRLAERSSNATKQIEALVKTIQTDTNEAVISMEHTTTEVVNGARLAQDAGVALEEIEKVSANLSSLIQGISNAAKQQSTSASSVSNTMRVIQEIATQTSAGTTEVANDIDKLAQIANEMRESVSGFKVA